MSKRKTKKAPPESPSGFSFSRMHRMLKKKKKEEKKEDIPRKKETGKKAKKKPAPGPGKKIPAEPVPSPAVNPVAVSEEKPPVPTPPPAPPPSVPAVEPVLKPEVISPPPPPLPEFPSAPVTLPRTPQQLTSPARNQYPTSRFAGGEKRTTIRISTDLADRAKEFENKVYWLTKRRLSLAEQARIALTLFMELPLGLEDMTADDDMELYILQKARKLLAHLPAPEIQPDAQNGNAV